MFWLLYFVLFLVCAGITLAYLVYLCRVWSAAAKSNERGLTTEDLEKLEEGEMAVGGGGECAVCQEEMAAGQAVRVLPRCCHAFHRHCADAWLQLHPVCPLCRARLLPPLSLPPSQPQPQPPPSCALGPLHLSQ